MCNDSVTVEDYKTFCNDGFETHEPCLLCNSSDIQYSLPEPDCNYFFEMIFFKSLNQMSQLTHLSKKADGDYEI